MKRYRLAAAAPPWFEIRRESDTGLEGVARVPRTCWAYNGIAITIQGNRPVVRETVPGSQLPCWCLERHIFGESEFCLGLTVSAIQSQLAAQRWWSQLAQYIACQSVANETGLWPLMNGLDHGGAGRFHNHALDLAEQLGIIDEYHAIHTGYADDFSPETNGALRGDPRFRKLRELELRRLIEKAANDSLARDSTHICCGTMRDCPYRAEHKRLLRRHPNRAAAGYKPPTTLMGSVSALALNAMHIRPAMQRYR